MKLQKQIAYKYKDRKHYKYVIVLPEDTVSKLGWKEGQDLRPEIDGSRLIIELEEKTL